MRWSRSLGSRRQGFALALLLYAVAAHAGPPACAPDIVGPWTGHVLDEGRIKELRTRFSILTGALTGTYHVEDAATPETVNSFPGMGRTSAFFESSSG